MFASIANWTGRVRIAYLPVTVLAIVIISAQQFVAQDGDSADSLAGTWTVKYQHLDGTINTEWEIRRSGNQFALRIGRADNVFTRHGTYGDGETIFLCKTYMIDLDNELIGESRFYLSKDGNRFRGENGEVTESAGVITATRNDSRETPPELYLEAGRATVRSGQTVSIPVYLRSKGSAPTRNPANMNFELTYKSRVAQVLPHPTREQRSPSPNTKEAPNIPRGNLLGQSVLIAGNHGDAGKVLVGYAGNSGVRPGVGKPGETVTEVYFKAVGNPGDYTDLSLKITTANDEHGHDVHVIPVHGRITILKEQPRLPGPTVCPPSPNGRWTALDAYKALLMSVSRLDADTDYDVDTDSQITSSDSRKILQEAIQIFASATASR